ncbi:tetratricopeptide (TPR) repeat protein [Desulfobaculum xiamenense]|uniref:Tetratricopeptide (TPR) repeat protein n=1 Tax=Desulfobaculum xiamenense TaxID=995050 RepID=A0A846QLC2_9BACT|nr:SPOR domain-containing protein [Desulfobaculum xiamenense]NJB67262.1 tetratricopeptide (TPR) repeat protein [Desulfobaculum xiamenense]
MTYATARTITCTILVALLTALSGCAGTQQSGGRSMSLMEKFHAGKPLMEDAKAPAATDADAPEQARALTERGEAFAKAGHPETAFQFYMQAVALDPTLMRAHLLKGLVLLDQGLTTEAMAEFETVLKAEPDNAAALEAAGIVYFRNALYDESAQRLARAVALDPARHNAYAHLGAIHNYRGKFAEAVKSFERALELSPDNSAVLNNLGITYAMMGREAEAVAAFTAAIRHGAPTQRTYNNMGLALARMGRYRQALEAFRNAEGDAAAYNNLGYVQFMKGEYDAAIACFEKAIRLEPSYYERANENLKRARLAREFAMASTAPAIRPVANATAQPEGLPLGLAAASANAEIVQTAQSPTQPSVLTPTPLGTQPVYSVHICSWRTKSKANHAARKLIRQGYAAHVNKADIPGKGTWYRVTVGEFMTLKDARALERRLHDRDGYRETRIMKRSSASTAGHAART